MQLAIKRFSKSKRDGFLKGFADVEMNTPWGKLTVYGVSIFDKNGSQWVSFPQKMLDDKTPEGKNKYFSHMRFSEHLEMDSFQQDLLNALQVFIQKEEGASVHDSNVKENYKAGEVPF